MKRAIAALVCVGLALSVPAHAQTNDDDYTPMGSRIKRERQFPLDLPQRYNPDRMNKVNRDRSKAMLNQFSKCLWRRSNEKSLDLLARTDLGFVDFKQIGLDSDRALRIYGFNDCLGRVADTHNTGVQLWFSPGGLRQWLLGEAYFDRYPDGPGWVKPGNVIGERHYPLSEGNQGVRAAMDFADCVVQTDPYTADFFFRAAGGSEDEKSALDSLTPSLGPCLPQGVQMGLSLPLLRQWLGEALWHGANNSAPAGDTPEGTE